MVGLPTSVTRNGSASRVEPPRVGAAIGAWRSAAPAVPPAEVVGVGRGGE